ncbi:hypothetical protein N7526_000633 [Penicillium atrosanguineum]|nr:hypothetical protein N7526_000633 [Penicillium atrosanguineum]
MPRKSAKKQTRLAFAPTVASPSRDGDDDNSDRFARLSYGHPSMASVRAEISQKSKASGSKKKSSSKFKERTPDLLEESPGKQIGKVLPKSKPKKSRQASKLANNEIVEEISRPRRRLKRKAESSPAIVLSDSDESEDPVISSPVKRRRHLPDPETPQTPRSSEDQDDLDIQEDLRDLQDSDDRLVDLIISQLSRKPALAAALLNRREISGSNTWKLSVVGVSDFQRESESETASANDEDESEDELEDGADASPTRRVESRDQLDSDVESAIDPNEDLDKYEDDFVLEDDTTELGVPMEEMPFEFTRHAYKQPKEYFRDVVGWMVHNRLDPAFPRDDDMYKVAFMKLEDEVKARAGSQLISSVWNSEFVRALRARPHIDLSAFPTDLGHSCDACKRSGHPASSDIRLYGKAYSLATLEPLNDESSEDSDNSDSSEASGVERDRDGHELPGEEKRFYLGRHCKDKAQLAHTLMHWRYQLNEWVVDHLDRMGQMKDSEILRRNNLSQKRKTRNAIEIIKQMAEAGEIEKLWRDFHIALKSAREKMSILG